MRPGALEAGLIALGIFGAALFYGDGMITPAISVLSAIEGVEVAAPGLSELVVPLIVVSSRLFSSSGSAPAGRPAFGPVMVVWFLASAACGVPRIVEHPAILGASPDLAIEFLVGHLATRSSRWARSSSPSPAPRRSMPTWATSAARRSPGMAVRWSSRPTLNYSARAR